jgi:hypothetical protein
MALNSRFRNTSTNMQIHFLRPLLLGFILSHSVYSLAQVRGVYEPVSRPKDAPPYTGNEFSVKTTQATIALKLGHRLKITTTNLDGSNLQVVKGRWEAKGNNILFRIPTPDSLQIGVFEHVTLKSGVYIKLKNGYWYYYKKK